MEDFLCLVVHLELLFGVVVIGKNINMGDHVVQELMGKLINLKRSVFGFVSYLLA